MEHLRRLIEHMSWADELARSSLIAAGESAPAEALELYRHVIAAEHVWLRRLKGAPPDVAVWPVCSIDELATLEHATHAQLREQLAALKPVDLAREVAYVNSAGQAFRSKVEDILLHVCLHGAYHRGQIAQLVRQHGALPSATDYIGFVRGAPAATRGS